MVKKAGIGTVVLAFFAFISLGMPDGLHGVAWPGIRESLGLPLDALGLLLIFGTAGYMTSGLFSGLLIRKLGVGKLLTFSVLTTSVSLLVYSLSPFWWLFVLIAVIGGFGAGAIDAGLNLYIAKNHSERLMQWLHASFGVGITFGPVIMTAGISITGSWRWGYAVVAAIQVLLALAFFITRNWWKNKSADLQEAETALPADQGSRIKEEVLKEAGILETILHIPALLSMLMFFIYTGVELGLGIWAYSLLTEARGVDPIIAGYITGAYWGMFTVGRIIAGFISGRVRIRPLVLGSILLAAVGLLILMFGNNTVLAIAGISITGIAIAPIFPGMVSGTADRVDSRHVANTIGLQITAAGLGIAVLPSAAGLIAASTSLESIPIFLIAALGILFVFFISVKPKRT